jgi:arylformamidase
MSEWIDVTRLLDENTVCWPGDTPFSRRQVSALPDGDACNLSDFESCLHIGTHIDAPLHFIDRADDVSQIPLSRLCGRARVVAFPQQRHITASDLQRAEIERSDRLLLKTSNERLWRDTHFREDFIAITADAADWLVEQGIQLVGIDYLSIDPFKDQAHPAHHALLAAGVPIIEGLDLSSVQPGIYEMVALPLRIRGAEASPARVILRSADAKTPHS